MYIYNFANIIKDNTEVFEAALNKLQSDYEISTSNIDTLRSTLKDQLKHYRLQRKILINYTKNNDSNEGSVSLVLYKDFHKGLTDKTSRYGLRMAPLSSLITYDISVPKKEDIVDALAEVLKEAIITCGLYHEFQSEWFC